MLLEGRQTPTRLDLSISCLETTVIPLWVTKTNQERCSGERFWTARVLWPWKDFFRGPDNPATKRFISTFVITKFPAFPRHLFSPYLNASMPYSTHQTSFSHIRRNWYFDVCWSQSFRFLDSGMSWKGKCCYRREEILACCYFSFFSKGFFRKRTFSLKTVVKLILFNPRRVSRSGLCALRRVNTKG